MAGDAVRRRTWTIANVVMLLAFAFSVVVQVNDPDPWSWILIYAAALMICAAELGRRTRPASAAIVGVAALAWAATIAPRVIGRVRFLDMFEEFEMRGVGIEESREMYGLLIIALWMAAVVVAAWRRRRAATRTSPQGAERPQHHGGVS